MSLVSVLNTNLSSTIKPILKIPRFSDIPFSPSSLFSNGEQGVWYDPSDISTLFQDDAGSIAVTASGQPLGSILDKSINANHATQSIASRRLTYTDAPDRLVLDKVDDAIVIEIPTGGFVGSLVVATDEGTASYGVDIPAGNYTLGGQNFAGDSINGVLLREGSVSASDLAKVEQVFVANGSTASYVGATNFNSYWRDRTDITVFPLIDTSSGTSFFGTWRNCSSIEIFILIDTSSGTDFFATWLGCSSLTSFPLIDTSSGTDFSATWFSCSNLTSFPLIDTSSGTNFVQTWYGCSNLTSFPLIDVSSGTNFTFAWRDCSSLTSFPLLDVSSGTNFFAAWRGCSSLTSFPANFFDNCQATNFSRAFEGTNLSQESIDGILTSINSNGTSNGTFDQSGDSAPSSIGEAAITDLRNRGWTITVTGGF